MQLLAHSFRSAFDYYLYPNQRTRLPLYLTLLFALVLTACGGSDKSSSVKESFEDYQYQQPELRNDGWQVAHINEFDIAPADFERMVQRIAREANGYRHIDSVMVIKNGKIILDESFRDQLDLADEWANNQDLTLHILNSVTKSVTSALIGIAIEQGVISGVDVKVHDYFQHKLPVANWSEEKADITLKNWLTMRHGYLWDEWDVSYLNSENLNAQMNNNSDPIRFLLSRPMETEPGSTFAYSTGVSFGLGRLLEHATGQSVDSFMEQHLFSPLGINNYTYWSLDGQLHTGSALYLMPRDMAKFGQLFLNQGQWQGQQVISADWVAESTALHYNAGTWGYGYQWWLTEYSFEGRKVSTYYADGFGGQYIFIIPEFDAVIVFTGSAYRESESQEYRVHTIIEEDILPSLK